MEVSDLMVGDWVMLDMNWAEDDPMYARPNYQPYQIKRGEDIDLAQETNCIGDADAYQPIPLTDEVLEKNGWNIEEYPAMCNGTEDWAIWPVDSEIEMSFRLQRGYDENLWWMVAGIGGLVIPINYVHELQHALRLCKVEKEITL